MLNYKKFIDSLLSKTNEYLIKYKLRRKLLLLEKPFSTFTDNLMFPNPVKRIVQGFIDFQYSEFISIPIPNINNLTEKTKCIMEFCIFVIKFGTMLDKLNEEGKEHYLKRFDEICKDTATAFDKIKGFYFEIKIFPEFCIRQGFKLESIPEINDRKNGVPEFLISKNGQKFSIECKTISPEKYHPIGKREAETFFNMLLKCEEYKQQVPEDSFASVEFTFDKSLKDSASEKMNENFYTPSQLLSFYKQVKDNPAHVTTTILNNKDCIRRLEDWEGGQKFGLTGEIKQGIKHQLILHSTSSNLYMKGIIDVIDKAIEKKVNDVYPYPLFLCLEFFDLPFDFKNTIEEHINNKYKEKQLSISFFQTSGILRGEWLKFFLEGETFIQLNNNPMSSILK
jgi:hypothetical protein